jgi:hypothetical protein
MFLTRSTRPGICADTFAQAADAPPAAAPAAADAPPALYTLFGGGGRISVASGLLAALNAVPQLPQNRTPSATG